MGFSPSSFLQINNFYDLIHFFETICEMHRTSPELFPSDNESENIHVTEEEKQEISNLIDDSLGLTRFQNFLLSYLILCYVSCVNCNSNYNM